MPIARILIVLSCLIGFAAALPVQAQEVLSPGCQNIIRLQTPFPMGWAPGVGGGTIQLGAGNFYFEAGEVISILPSAAMREYLTGRVDLGQVGNGSFQTEVSASLPNPSLAPITFTIPASGVYNIGYLAEMTNNSSSSMVYLEVTITCSRPEQGSFNDGRLPIDEASSAIYANSDGIFVYTDHLSFGGGQWVVINAKELAQYPTLPTENTLLESSEDGYVSIYLLTTGEYQINIGPDAEGKVIVVIFTGLPPTNVYRQDFNINDILYPD